MSSLKFFGGFAPEESVPVLKTYNTFLKANLCEICKTFGGFAPRESLSSVIVRFVPEGLF